MNYVKTRVTITYLLNTLIVHPMLHHLNIKTFFRFTFVGPAVTSPQQCEVCVSCSGLCQGLVMWWELTLCPNVSLSTSPWKRTQVNFVVEVYLLLEYINLSGKVPLKT